MMNDLESPTTTSPMLRPGARPDFLFAGTTHATASTTATANVSSVATLASKEINPTQHVRRLSTGQMADETLPKERIDIINDFLQERVTTRPLIGVVCGSGLGGLSKCLENQRSLNTDIPPVSPVHRRGPRRRAGLRRPGRYPCRVHARPLPLLRGYAMRETALPIRVMYLLDLMIHERPSQHARTVGSDPLIGPNDSRFGARFHSVVELLRQKVAGFGRQSGQNLGLTQKVRKGVYCFVSGPTYETPTECRFLRLVGAMPSAEHSA
ncbi:Purine nucleoside phosphorylase [Phytophthora cactorum]|nr:Purine nucleoside phosphorylase [Phytophthora cactorum]